MKREEPWSIPTRTNRSPASGRELYLLVFLRPFLLLSLPASFSSSFFRRGRECSLENACSLFFHDNSSLHLEMWRCPTARTSVCTAYKRRKIPRRFFLISCLLNAHQSCRQVNRSIELLPFLLFLLSAITTALQPFFFPLLQFPISCSVSFVLRGGSVSLVSSYFHSSSSSDEASVWLFCFCMLSPTAFLFSTSSSRSFRQDPSCRSSLSLFRH